MSIWLLMLLGAVFDFRAGRRPLPAKVSSIEECDRTIQSLTWQSRHGKPGQKCTDPFNIGALIPEKCVVMGAAKRQ